MTLWVLGGWRVGAPRYPVCWGWRVAFRRAVAGAARAGKFKRCGTGLRAGRPLSPVTGCEPRQERRAHGGGGASLTSYPVPPVPAGAEACARTDAECTFASRWRTARAGARRTRPSGAVGSRIRGRVGTARAPIGVPVTTRRGGGLQPGRQQREPGCTEPLLRVASDTPVSIAGLARTGPVWRGVPPADRSLTCALALRPARTDGAPRRGRSATRARCSRATAAATAPRRPGLGETPVAVHQPDGGLAGHDDAHRRPPIA